MKYAIVENGEVINIAEGNRAINSKWIPIPVGSSVSIGDTYDGQLFYSPDGRVRMTPEQAYIAEKLEACEAAFSEGVSEGWA